MDQQKEEISQVSIEEEVLDQQEEENIQDMYNCTIQLQKDLEFIQLLASSEYIIQLHMRGYFYDDRFQQYIQKLKYLNNEKYITLIKYPEGLLNLDRIKSKGFAEFLKNTDNQMKFRKICLLRNQIIAQHPH